MPSNNEGEIRCMIVDCHHAACVRGDLMKIPICQTFFFEDWDCFKIGEERTYIPLGIVPNFGHLEHKKIPCFSTPKHDYEVVLVWYNNMI